MLTCTASGASTNGLAQIRTSSVRVSEARAPPRSPPLGSPTCIGSSQNSVSTYLSLISPGLSVVSCPRGAATMCMIPMGQELPTSCLPALVGMFPSTGKAAGPHDSLVLSARNWRVHSGFLLLFPSLATQGCFRAGRTDAVTFLVRRAGSPCSPQRLQRAARCLSYHKGSLASKSTGHGCGFSLRRAKAR